MLQFPRRATPLFTLPSLPESLTDRYMQHRLPARAETTVIPGIPQASMPAFVSPKTARLPQNTAVFSNIFLQRPYSQRISMPSTKKKPYCSSRDGIPIPQAARASASEPVRKRGRFFLVSKSPQMQEIQNRA